ncbi:acyltransferase family protein [Enterococcus sp. AZ163]|uniref:acyltransferase family protein n=1 Tax=Enterococcus sp. AZ163 TaxID=2774638 RepID=UPI003D2BD931
MFIIKKRLISIDIAKGITILLVVFGHALQGVVDSNSLSLVSNNSSVYILKEIIYGFHMPAFFIISGLFLDSWLSKKLNRALKQKLTRLVYPYFVWSLLTACFMQVGSSYTNNSLGLKEFLLSPIVPFSQYWFLYVLFFFYLVTYMIHSLFRDKYKICLLIISLLIFVINPIIPNVWIIDSFSKYLVYFSMGTFLLPYFKQKQKEKKFKMILVCIAFIVVNFVYVNLLWRDLKSATYYYYLVTAITGSLLIFEISSLIANTTHFKRAKKNLASLGENSMQIYVMHLIPLAGLRIVCEKILNISNLWIIILVTFFLSMLLCIFASGILKKFNVQRIFFG